MTNPKERRTEPASKSISAPASSRGRRLIFRAFAALIVPLILLSLIETGLRMGGFGHSTSFFLKKPVGGRTKYISNDDFGRRFFPPEVARSPSPAVMEFEKGANAFRIFILGESAALGDPEPAFGFGRYLEVLLQERFPGVRFEVVCTAMTAINSHVILPIARECARRDGDLWVVYMGNNEFVGPYGAATAFGPQVPGLGFIRSTVALKTTRIYQELEDISRRFRDDPTRQPSWGGMKMFLDHQVPPDDPRKERIYSYFRRNLEDILHVAETSGIKVVLSTVASNERDCSPFASHLSAAANDRPITEWRPFVEAGLRAESNADFTGAISNYLAASTAAAMFADVQFRLGRSYLALRNPVEARRRLELARDYDSLPFRADSHINGVIRDVAAKRGGKGFSFVDAAETIAKDSPQGIAGNEFFYEHVHLNFEGNYRLARIVADGILPLLPDSISKHGKEEWAAADLCNRRLALSDWDRYRVYDNIGHRLLEPPFVNQSSHPVSLQKNHDELVATRSYFGKEALKAARLAYQEALSSVPEDFYLHGNYAKLMEDTGDAGGAVKEWERVRELLPYEAAPYYYLGRLAARQKKNQEAIQMLSKALEIRPNLVDALDEKGRLLTTMGRTDDALIDLREAFRLQPGNSRVAIHMADALAAQGKKKEAMDYLIRAVTAQPSNWEAHYYLGVELAVRDRVGDAAKEFGEVVRLRPEFPLGHLNLAIALAKAGKVDDAIKQLNETLRLDPKNEKARQYAETLRAMRPLDP